MSLTLPYGQNHYMGEYATEAAALTWIQGNKWDSDGDGTGTARAGMAMFDTAVAKLKVHDGSAWVEMGSATPAGSDTQIQFNDGGSAFGAESTFTWNKTKDYLKVGTNGVFQFNGGGSYYYGIAVSHTASGNDHGGIGVEVAAGIPRLHMYRANGTVGTRTIAANTDYLGLVQFYGFDGTEYELGGGIRCVVEGAPATNNMPARLEFTTRPDSDTGPYVRLAISPTGKLSTGAEAAPDCDPGGICINHGAGDGFPITIKNSDVNHPFTTLCEADTYVRTSKTDSTAGGFNLIGLGTASNGISLLLGGANTTPVSGTSDGCVVIVAYKSDGGTGVANLAATENLCAFRSWATTKVVIKGSGDIQTLAGLKIGAYGQSAAAGAIEWNGTNFRGYNGSGWNLLDVGSPAGSAYQIQYNTGSGFGATADFYWELTNSRIWTVGDGKYAGHHAIVYDTGSGSYGAFATYRFGGTKSSPLAVSSGMFLGSFSMAGAFNSTSTASAWNFLGYASGTWSSGSTPSYLQLLGRNTSTNQYQIMRWDYAGNVAIGTHASPAERLDLQDGSGNGAIRIGNTGGSNAGTIKYASNTFSGYNGSTWVNLGAGGVPAGSDTQIQFNDGGSAFGAESNFTWNKTKDYLKIGTNGSMTQSGTTYNYGLTLSHTQSGSDLGGIVVETAGAVSRVQFHRANGTVSARTIVANNDPLGTLNFYGFDGTDYKIAALTRAVADGTPASDNMPGRLEFLTRPTGSGETVIERARITNEGNLYIGTTSGMNVNGSIQNFPLIVYSSDSNPQFSGVACESSGNTSRFPGYRHNGTLASKTAVANGDPLSTISAIGWDGGTTPTYVTAAFIQFLVDGTVSEDIVPGRIVFTTRNTSGTVAEKMRIANDGKISSYQMYSGYTVGGTNKAVYVDNAGLIGVLSSSLRTKQNVTDMESVGWVYSLRPVNFEYKNSPSVKQYGLIAEEVAEVNESLVGFDVEGLPDSVTYDRLVPVLLKAVQDLYSEVCRLKNIIEVK